MFWQSRLLPRRRALGDLTLCIIHLVAIRQIDNLLSIIGLVFDRQDHRIGDNVVEKSAPIVPGKPI